MLLTSLRLGEGAAIVASPVDDDANDADVVEFWPASVVVVALLDQ